MAGVRASGTFRRNRVSRLKQANERSVVILNIKTYEIYHNHLSFFLANNYLENEVFVIDDKRRLDCYTLDVLYAKNVFVATVRQSVHI